MKKIFITIHNLLYTDCEKIVVDGNSYPVQIASNGCKCLIFRYDRQEWEIIQQNKDTRSIYGRLAREGKKISWLIPHYAGFRTSYGWLAITEATRED